jgi:hypothetical protein
MKRAWNDRVSIAAFGLGALYEHVVRKGDTEYVLGPNDERAWSWYQKGVDAGEPNALARFGQREDLAVPGARDLSERNARLLKTLMFYASASERARLEDRPDSAWRDWRYRRASIARLLAREGIMEPVARIYDEVRKRYASRPTLWHSIASKLGR